MNAQLLSSAGVWVEESINIKHPSEYQFSRLARNDGKLGATDFSAYRDNVYHRISLQSLGRKQVVDREEMGSLQISIHPAQVSSELLMPERGQCTALFYRTTEGRKRFLSALQCAQSVELDDMIEEDFATTRDDSPMVRIDDEAQEVIMKMPRALIPSLSPITLFFHVPYNAGKGLVDVIDYALSCLVEKLELVVIDFAEILQKHDGKTCASLVETFRMLAEVKNIRVVFTVRFDQVSAVDENTSSAEEQEMMVLAIRPSDERDPSLRINYVSPMVDAEFQEDEIIEIEGNDDFTIYPDEEERTDEKGEGDDDEDDE